MDFNKTQRHKIRAKAGVDWRVNHATIILLSFLSKKKLEKNIFNRREAISKELELLKEESNVKQTQSEEGVKKELEARLIETSNSVQRKIATKKANRKMDSIRGKSLKESKRLDKSIMGSVQKDEVKFYHHEEQTRRDISRFLSSVIYNGYYFYTNEIDTSAFKDNIIIVKKLNKKIYSEKSVFHVLKNVDITIKRGEIVAIMGQSGSGKTTLLNILSGIENSTSGDVLFDGANLTYLDDKEMMKFRKKNVSIVFQGHNLLDNISVYANATVGTGFSSKKIKREDVIEALKVLGIYEMRNKFPSKLSGGQKQRVALARAILKYPKVLFCDEPTAALDKTTGQEIVNLLKELRDKYGTTIVIVTHSPSVARQADRILTIEKGNIMGSTENKRTYEAIANEVTKDIIETNNEETYIYSDDEIQESVNSINKDQTKEAE